MLKLYILGIDFSDCCVTIGILIIFMKNQEECWRCELVAYRINDDCISCGTCEEECPVSAISAGDDKYVIDADACVDCGACASVCPVDAPVQD